MGKTKSMLLAAVAAAAFAMPANALLVVNNIGAASDIASDNDFAGDLNDLGLYRQAVGGYTVSVSGAPVNISVYYTGSESGLDNFVQIGGSDYAENNTGWHIGNLLVTYTQSSDGLLEGNINFWNAGEAGEALGSNQVAVFIPRLLPSNSYSNNDLYFGFNDSGSPDGDFDDFIIRISSSPVPEPATWAMMVLGLGLVGAGMRRRRTTVSFV